MPELGMYFSWKTHTQCSSENSRPFRPGDGESVWIPDFLNMPSSLSSEGEFHLPLGWMPPISACLFSHSASRYVQKKKRLKDPNLLSRASHPVPSQSSGRWGWEERRWGWQAKYLALQVAQRVLSSSIRRDQVWVEASSGWQWSAASHAYVTCLSQSIAPRQVYTSAGGQTVRSQVSHSNDVIERPQESESGALNSDFSSDFC